MTPAPTTLPRTGADPGGWRAKRDDVVSAPAPSATAAIGPDGPGALFELLLVTLTGLADGRRARGGPLPSGGVRVVADQVRAALGGRALPESGIGARDALADLTRVLAYGAADPAHPHTAAHLHCPPLAVAAAADLAVSALNPSLDSWDQAPAATALEAELVRELAALVGYDPELAAGSMTTGGTESNLMGLLLAREDALPGTAALGLAAAAAGGPVRILCSQAAHFSLARNAGLLGLGERAVLGIPVDEGHRMDPVALNDELNRMKTAGRRPIAIVATAGTTDFGSVDPLPRISEIASAHGVWLHVDAAYGGGVLFSDRLAPLLSGIGSADSVGLDFHKFGWQPAAAGVFLARRAESFAPIERNVAYLNPVDDEEDGYPSLLGRSLRTTRRADAFKVAVTLRALGRKGLGELVERCHDLARYAAGAIEAHPALALEAPPVLSTVVFAYRGCPPAKADKVNAALRRRLLAEGRAVVGRTAVASGTDGSGTVRLKLTLLNPATTPTDIDTMLAAITAAGEEVTC